MLDEPIVGSVGSSSSEPTESGTALQPADRNHIEEEKSPQILYIITESDNGPCKVGISNDVDRRLWQIQTGNPRKLKIFGEISCAEAAVLEIKVHEALSEFNLVGEWFDVSPLQVADVCDMICYGKIYKKCDQCSNRHSKFLSCEMAEKETK